MRMHTDSANSLLIGVDTFGDVTLHDDGTPKSHPEVLRDVVAEGVLADQVGLHSFGVGEHHRKDFAVSAPDVVLAAIAGKTENIRLASAVTVLSSDDPIRVFQRFSTLHALSNGRAEVVLGRGSFIESFPLFGYDLEDYEVLFEERLALFDKARSQKPIHWEGRTRGPIRGLMAYPQLEEGLLPVSVGVGGSPQSVVRAASYGYPLTLAIIGGEPARFRPYADLYYKSLEQHGKEWQPLSVHSPGHVADTDEQAQEEFFPHWLATRNRLGSERGWGAGSRIEFNEQVAAHGALYVGSPETVAKKIAATAKKLKLQRFDLKYSNGTLPHSSMMKSIELLGTKVSPLVDDMLS
ncbi:MULTISPECIES: LLM class flavin-dependent oxidoreductase [Arthrobacter]|uniref:LLM class flavin-dependent oxidoreductase n=2 Tax=Arthrobacter TaxID=1663 RepID=A0ABU9KNP9_9MICC|nr:LLM class flavin-dependent oxidoreductase [Arthrobacter sp. YJM1]MDP5227175.1 LLM class flavin-dependent oxidoreductase [Arthrobacter sp. YJM1]